MRHAQHYTHDIPNGAQRIFAYPSEFGLLDDYCQHRGQVVTIVRPCTSSEVDDECQPMYLVEASDGWQGMADEVELEPNIDQSLGFKVLNASTGHMTERDSRIAHAYDIGAFPVMRNMNGFLFTTSADVEMHNKMSTEFQALIAAAPQGRFRLRLV